MHEGIQDFGSIDDAFSFVDVILNARALQDLWTALFLMRLILYRISSPAINEKQERSRQYVVSQ